MTPQQEIIDSIQILIERAMERATRISNGNVTAFDVNNNTCTVTLDGKTYDNITYYGVSPVVNKQYRVFIPEGNMSRAFIMVV